jgi:hypothetical protein
MAMTKYRRSAHLQRVTPLRFAVDHFHDVLVQLLSRRVSLCPVVSRTTAVLGHEDVLWVIEIREWGRQYIVYDLPGVQAFRVYITTRGFRYMGEQQKRTRGSRSMRIARGM